MTEWVDATSYSQNARGKQKPRIWECKLGPWRASVHRHLNWPEDAWLLSCDVLNVRCHDLEQPDLQRAQRKALRVLHGKVQWIARELALARGQASAPVVKLSLAERFLDWFPKHTKLYIRGQRGKDWAEQRRLESELAEALNPFLRQLVSEALEDLEE
jgi:hypothetical protein